MTPPPMANRRREDAAARLVDADLWAGPREK
jgi:hypothetical protein